MNPKVYFLQHPGGSVNGQHGPIEWTSGIGSTSSKVDRDWAVNELGAADVTATYEALAAAAPVTSLGTVECKTYRVAVSYLTFSADAYTADKVIASLPAKARLIAVYADTTIPYTGGDVSAATLCLGKTVGGAEWIATHDVFSAPVRDGFDFGGGMLSWTAAGDISVRLETTTGKTNVLTAGATTFYLICEIF